MEAAGELGDRRSVARKRSGREESPDSIVAAFGLFRGRAAKGSAPGNARGLRKRMPTPSVAGGLRGRGYGKCHRK